MKQVTLERVHKEIESLKKLVVAMQETIADCFLTAEEENFEKGLKELENGETISLQDLELERKDVKS
ncbi:hypothetical protein DRN69_05600 [Candidatus Pacearchaeota archaeon]|nr:MAG: hypothetical protein DRN69_05600 [Candidatus Pacearchaeota archaeon]